MNLRKLGLIVIVVLLSVCLLVPIAEAKGKKKEKKAKTNLATGVSSHIAQVGLDLGANVFGYIPYGTISVTSGDDKKDASFSGSGNFGPYLGAHAHLFFSGWIIRGEFGYGYQSGIGKINFDDKDIKDEEFDFALNNLKLGVGVGKTLIKHRIVHPYIVGILDYHYLTFKDKDVDESATGSGVGVGGVVGVDVLFLKNFFAGGGARIDLIYSLNPLTLDRGGNSTEITMGYLPICFFLTGGYLF